MNSNVDGKEFVERMSVTRISSGTREEEKSRDKNAQDILILSCFPASKLYPI